MVGHEQQVNVIVALIFPGEGAKEDDGQHLLAVLISQKLEGLINGAHPGLEIAVAYLCLELGPTVTAPAVSLRGGAFPPKQSPTRAFGDCFASLAMTA